MIDIYRELQEFGIEPLVHDPKADRDQIMQEYGVELSALDAMHRLDVLIFAVPHSDYVELAAKDFNEMVGPNGILVDIKACVDPATLRDDIRYWSL